MTDSQYQIRSDVPPPPARTVAKYQFASLEVGQCFIVALDEDEQDPATVLRRVQGAVTWANRSKTPKRFFSRRFDHEGKDCVGVWREK
jgi:hypothetical protein